MPIVNDAYICMLPPCWPPAVPRIKQVVQRTLNLDHQPPIAANGQAFVREQLTTEALHCYWLGALQRYMELYFLPKTQAQLAEEEKATGPVGRRLAAASAAA